MDLTYGQIIAVILFGVISGFINTVAGGGSLLTVSFYLYLGIPPIFANYANRIPVFAQTSTATFAYAVKKKIKVKEIFPYLAPMVCGGIVGAFFAIEITERLVNRVLLGVLIFTLVSLVSDLFREKTAQKFRWIKGFFVQRPSYWMIMPILLVVGFYGGFIQIGVGLIIYPIMHVILGERYLNANIIKVSTVACMSALSLIIFSSQITTEIFCIGAITAAGSIVGSLIGVKATIGTRGETIIRTLLCAVSVIGIVRLFFIV